MPADGLPTMDYTIIEEILKNRQDELPLDEQEQGEETGMPTHENIRGKEYYN